MTEKKIVAILSTIVGILVFFTTELKILGLLLILLAALVVKGSMNMDVKNNNPNNKPKSID